MGPLNRKPHYNTENKELNGVIRLKVVLQLLHLSGKHYNSVGGIGADELAVSSIRQGILTLGSASEKIMRNRITEVK